MTDTNDTQKNAFSEMRIPNFVARLDALPQSAQSLLAIQKNNVETMKKIQNVFMENLQEISQRQSAVFSQIMAQTTTMANDMSYAGKPEDKLSHNMVAIKKSYEDAMTNAKEISMLVKKANDKATKIFKDGVSQNYKQGHNASVKDAAAK